MNEKEEREKKGGKMARGKRQEKVCFCCCLASLQHSKCISEEKGRLRERYFCEAKVG